MKNKDIVKNGVNIANDVISVMKCEYSDGCDNSLRDVLMNDAEYSEYIELITNEDRLSEAVTSFNRDEKEMQRRNLVDCLKKRRSRRLIPIAVRFSATVAAMVVVSMIILNYADYSPVKTSNVESEYSKILKPMLILADSSNVDLTATNKTSENHDFIVEESGSKIISKSNNNTISYNTLAIPAKYTYSIVLEDGTEVTLNANTTLRYPTRFTGSAREVFLDGEAYFDVTKSEIPFIVHISDMYVKVYGTEFNINGYKKNIIETILVKGSVGVGCNNRDDIEETKIIPNQRLNYNTNLCEMVVEDVDCSELMSWKDEMFKCREESLVNILSDIENWYGIKIESQNEKIENIIISLSLQRSLTVDEMFSIIEKITELKIINEGDGKYTVE